VASGKGDERSCGRRGSPSRSMKREQWSKLKRVKRGIVVMGVIKRMTINKHEVVTILKL